MRGRPPAARFECNRISFPTIVLAAVPASQAWYGARKRAAAAVRRGPRFPVAEEGATGGWKALRSLLPYLRPSDAPSLRLRDSRDGSPLRAHLALDSALPLMLI